MKSRIDGETKPATKPERTASPFLGGNPPDARTLLYLQAAAGNRAVLSLPPFAQRAPDDAAWQSATTKQGTVDIGKEKTSIGDDLNAAAQAAGRLRKSAMQQGLLPEKVFNAWIEADKSLIALEPGMVGGKVQDRERAAAVAAMAEFYHDLRSAVEQYDVESHWTDKAGGKHYQYANRFLSQQDLTGTDFYRGISQKLQDAKTIDDWTEVAASFRSTCEKMDNYVAEKAVTSGLQSPNGSISALEGALVGSQADAATRQKAVTTLVDFYRGFRAAVTPLDVVQKDSKINLEWVENAYLGPRDYDSLVQEVQSASSPGQWKRVFKDFHRMDAAQQKFVKNPEIVPSKGPAAQLRYYGGLTGQIAGFRLQHPNAKKLRAAFYAEKQKDDVAHGQQPEPISLYFYLYYEKGKWRLVDLTTPHHEKVNKEAGPQEKPPLVDLFKQLDSRLRFPKGMLEYETPDGGRDHLQTTEPWSLTEWAGKVGLVLALAGLTIASGGASAIATVFLIGAGVAGVVAAGADLAEKSKQGMLSTAEAALDVAMIVGTIASLGAAGVGRIAAIEGETLLARLAPFARGVFFPITGMAVAADAVSLGAMTADAWSQYQAIDEQKDIPPAERKLAHQRLAAMLMLQGGLVILSMKGQAQEMTGGTLKLREGEGDVKAQVEPQAGQRAAAKSPPEVPMAIRPNGKRVPPDHWIGGYHGSSEIQPQQAFENGLPARGTDWRLKEHADGNPDSAFRGSTAVIYDPVTEQGAAAFAGEGGWVYDIQGVPTWDVNRHLEGSVYVEGKGYRGNMLAIENEGAIPAQIPSRNIKRAGQVVSDSRGRLLVRDWVDNPNFGR